MLYAYTEQESQQPTTNRTLKKEKKKDVYIILYKARHPLKTKKKKSSWDSFKIK